MNVPQASFDAWPFCVYHIYGLTIFGAHWGNKNNALFLFYKLLGCSLFSTGPICTIWNRLDSVPCSRVLNWNQTREDTLYQWGPWSISRGSIFFFILLQWWKTQPIMIKVVLIAISLFDWSFEWNRFHSILNNNSDLMCSLSGKFYSSGKYKNILMFYLLYYIFNW